MMKIERDTVLIGTKIGEHAFDPESAIDTIRERVVERGFNLAYVRPAKLSITYSPEDYISWAKYLAENKIYFHFGAMAQNPPKDQLTKLTRETVEKIKEIAGEYFLGEAIREPGTHYAAKGPGYFTKGRGQEARPQRDDCADMKEAHRHYVDTISYYRWADKESGMPGVLAVEATALSKYNLEAGADIPILEVMNGNPDELIPTVRGAARGYRKDKWFSLIAHEWYGGFRNSDILKRKRLSLAMKYVYMSGAGSIMLESGDECIRSYGDSHEKDSELCREYQDNLIKIGEFIRSDFRPKGGPKVKFGFLFGLHDGWTGFCQSSVWNQFYREEWGHGSAEYSWRILDTIGTKRKWGDTENYGESDLSSMPAYGTYDIVPIEADVSILSKYDYLVFLGWNTMTDENMDKLTEYVKGGGRLLLSGAHLNYSVKREGEYIPPSEEKLRKLCGIRYTGEDISSNCGSKFNFEALDKRHLFPGTKTFFCDPIYSAGYTDYMKIELDGAVATASASDSFYTDPCLFETVIENKVGDGFVTLVLSKDYPGAPALTPLYSALVREMVSASARECDIKVIASEKLRYTVYEGNKIYLLNTDYDLPITVKIIYGDKEELITLESLEMKTVTLG
jgi:hypothetical protein